MAGVYRFEDLRVWQAAKRQCDLVGVLINRPAFLRDREIAQHMNDAALPVMFNISEGFLRRRDGETLQFLRYSFASNGELKAGYYAAESRRYLGSDEAAELIGPADQGRTKDQARTTDQGYSRSYAALFNNR